MKNLEKIYDLEQEYRDRRHFDVKIYVDDKCNQIINFFKKNSLDSVVLGISGGIDSAVTLFLLREAQFRSKKDNIIKQILPISMPIKNVDGVTGQDVASKYAKLVIDEYDPESAYEFDLQNTYESITNHSSIFDHEHSAWANGQMASVLRTPILYYHAALLQANGYKSLVTGTTNLSEYSIGFYGKASDMMVDVQFIMDIYKSEVYQVAEHLNVPKEILDRKPKGDVWDNRNDEEMIGAPYHFLEMYLQSKSYSEIPLILWEEKLSIEEYEICKIWIDNIEKHIAKNQHKFQVGLPCHILKTNE